MRNTSVGVEPAPITFGGKAVEPLSGVMGLCFCKRFVIGEPKNETHHWKNETGLLTTSPFGKTTEGFLAFRYVYFFYCKCQSKRFDRDT